MKRILIIAIGWMGLCSAAHAHGLHGPVEPRFHAMVHVLPFVGIALLVFGVGVYFARRHRDSSK